MASLLRSNVAVASGTAMSRVTGVARVAVLGAVLGTPGAVADAYDLANGTPNMVYELLLGGILSSSLVPVLTRLREEDDEEGTRAVVTITVLAMAAITVVAVVAAPWVFRLYSILTADSVDADAYRAVGAALSQMFLVQIFFYGLNAIGAGLLAARRRFFAAAWAPVLSNVVIIGSLVTVPSVARSPIALEDVLDDRRLRWLLGGGATAGIAVMAVALLPALHRAGIHIAPSRRWRHPAVRTLRRLSLWTLGYVAANQTALVVVRNLLRGGDGSAFAYSRAFLWFMLPHALFAMSITTTFQPDLVRAVTRGDTADLARRTTQGTRLITLLTMPAGVGLFVLREPLIAAIFQHGDATAADTAATARALAGFALGLSGFSVYLFALRVFYALEDARTPFLLNVVENVINIVLAVALVGRFGLLGLGAAFALAYLVSGVLSLVVLERRVPEIAVRPFVDALGPQALAATVMGLAVWMLTSWLPDGPGVAAATRLAVGGVAGTLVYTTVLFATRSSDLREAAGLIRGRAGRRGG